MGAIPFIIEQALLLKDDESIQKLPLLEYAPAQLEIPFQAVSAVIAGMFFNVIRYQLDFPDSHMAYIAFSEYDCDASKLASILCHLVTCSKAHSISTRKLFIARYSSPIIQHCDPTVPFSSVQFFEGGIPTIPGVLHVDFANQFLGGGVYSYGCVQEEIMFATHAGLLATVALCKRMTDSEAVVVAGVFRTAKHVGYRRSFAFVGPAEDDAVALTPAGNAASIFVAVDAINFATNDWKAQLGSFERELTKACAGFGCLDEGTAPLKGYTLMGCRQPVATGMWGCGAFNGDKVNVFIFCADCRQELKFVIQWLACSMSRRDMHFYVFDDRNFIPRAEHFAKNAMKLSPQVVMDALEQCRGETVKAGAFESILRVCEPALVQAQVQAQAQTQAQAQAHAPAQAQAHAPAQAPAQAQAQAHAPAQAEAEAQAEAQAQAQALAQAEVHPEAQAQAQAPSQAQTQAQAPAQAQAEAQAEAQRESERGASVGNQAEEISPMDIPSEGNIAQDAVSYKLAPTLRENEGQVGWFWWLR